MIQPKNETKDLIISLTKNCEKLIEQTYRISEETLESKRNKSRNTFLFKPSISLQMSWMIGLTSLEVFNSVSNVTQKNKKFELFIFPDEKSGGFTYEKVRDEIERDLDFSNITAADLQDDIIGPIIIKEY